MIKLTAITIAFRGRRHTFFVRASYDGGGRAHVSQVVIEQLLDTLKVRRGDTYTIG